MQDNDSTYQGWTNYPTWAVHLWLTNEEVLYHEAIHLAQRTAEVYQAADALKEYVEDLAGFIAPPVYEASFVADIFQWALAQTNWREVAKALRED